MRTIFFLIFLFLNLTGNGLIAQERVINARLKGEEIELRRFIAHNFKYPSSSQFHRSVGCAINSITITPKGEIAGISTINQIDEPIDEEINRVLLLTKNMWLKCDTISVDQTFYFQIVCALGKSPVVKNTVKDKYNFVDVIAITAFGLINNDFPESDESIATNLAKQLKKNNYKEALSYVDETIRRNPFNKELYQLRMGINGKLKNKDLVYEDLQKIQNFIPGVSLDELIIEN
jgi:hypothetical protein